ncbi:MarR family transcriptional regulator, partial [Staphylococcus aureus]|nr:MarR family transcriptional regulator [Staphylococcus aureus]
KREKLVVLTKEAEKKYEEINVKMLKFEEELLADFRDEDKEAFSHLFRMFLQQ